MIVIISGLYQGEYIITSHFGSHLIHHVPHVPHGGYQYPPCIAAPPGVICRSVSESGGTR